MSKVLLTSAYCPPIEYFAAIASEFSLQGESVVPAEVVLEASENYQKQSYRNRCTILSSQGPLDLSFPIVHINGTHNGIPIREVLVDYKNNWLLNHKRAIESAYYSSAYFEYYKDEFFSILERCPERLFDLNLSLLKFFLSKVGISANISFTDDYFLKYGPDVKDLRSVITPKRPNAIMKDLQLEKPYFQVFSGKYGFVGGLSIMDLLFNEGPDSILFLKNL